MLIRRGATIGLLTLGVAGLGMRPAPSAPRFPGYHWPTHAQTTYQLTLRVHEVDPGVGTSTSSSTTSWNPRVTIRTGAVNREGVSVTMDIQAAPYTTTAAGAQTSPPPMTLGAMSVQAVLTRLGRWRAVRWSLPAHPALPRQVLTAMLPLQDLLPRVPERGWTAGHAVLVPYSLGSLELPSFHVAAVRAGGPVPFAQWVVPSVGNHHWTVRDVLNTPRALSVFLVGPSTASRPNGLYPATLTAKLVTVDDLAGRDGGLLMHALGTAQVTAITPGNRLSRMTARWELTQVKP